MSDRETIAVYDKAWHAEIQAGLAIEPDISRWITPGRRVPAKDLEAREALGRQQVGDYLAYARSSAHLWQIWQTPDGPACEVPFEITLGGVRVIGFIDQVRQMADGTLRVTDLKTGTKLPSSAFQLAVYRQALGDVYETWPSYGDFYMCKNGSHTEPYDLRRWTTAKLSSWFSRMDESVTRGLFLPNPDSHCGICGVRDYCSAIGHKTWPENGEQH